MSNQKVDLSLTASPLVGLTSWTSSYAKHWVSNALAVSTHDMIHAEAKDLHGFLSKFVEKILELMHQGKSSRRLTALGALSAIVGAAEAAFRPYASAALQTLSPFLQVHLLQAHDCGWAFVFGACQVLCSIVSGDNAATACVEAIRCLECGSYQ